MLSLLIWIVLLTLLYACEVALSKREAYRRGDAQTGCCERELGDAAEVASHDGKVTGHAEGRAGLSSAESGSDMINSDDNLNNNAMDTTCALTSRLTPEILAQIAEWAVWNDEQERHRSADAETSVGGARGRQRTTSSHSDADVHRQSQHNAQTQSRRRRADRSPLSALCLAQTYSKARDAVLPVVWKVRPFVTSRCAMADK